MSRNLHLQVAKAWRIRRGEREAHIDLSLDLSAFNAAVASLSGYHAGGYEANTRLARAETIKSEIAALGPDIETLEAILTLVKHGITPREMRLISTLTNSKEN